MAIINSELTVAAQKSIDGKMFKIVGVQHVPYDSIADVISNIVSTRRHIGQVFRYLDGGGISDCHFIGGIADINLVKIYTGTTIPTLDQVADASIGESGFPELNDRSLVVVDTGSSHFIMVGNSDQTHVAEMSIDAGRPSFSLGIGSNGANLYADNIAGGIRNLQLPDANGTLIATVNGEAPDSAGNIDVSGSGIGLENAPTFAGISGSGQRVVIVAADETNNGDKSLYIYNGTSLIFIITIP